MKSVDAIYSALPRFVSLKDDPTVYDIYRGLPVCVITNINVEPSVIYK